MKKTKIIFSLALVLILFNRCVVFKSSTQATGIITQLANPPYIQPLNMHLTTDANGSLNATVDVQLVNGTGPITFKEAYLTLSIEPYNYKDANGNMHASKPLFVKQYVSQTFIFPAPDGTNIIKSLPLLSSPITPSQFTLNTSPDPQTGDYDRYAFTFYIGFSEDYHAGIYYHGMAVGGYTVFDETQYNDMDAILPSTPQNNYQISPIDYTKQFCIGHRRYDLQSNDNLSTPLTPYPDNLSRF